MKPYGVRVIQGPDVADIKEMGSKTCVGRFDEHGYFRNKAAKATTRRYWKRAARRANRELCIAD